MYLCLQYLVLHQVFILYYYTLMWGSTAINKKFLFNDKIKKKKLIFIEFYLVFKC